METEKAWEVLWSRPGHGIIFLSLIHCLELSHVLSWIQRRLGNLFPNWVAMSNNSTLWNVAWISGKQPSLKYEINKIYARKSWYEIVVIIWLMTPWCPMFSYLRQGLHSLQIFLGVFSKIAADSSYLT